MGARPSCSWPLQFEAGLVAGVYFLRSSDNKDKPLRIVKVRLAKVKERGAFGALFRYATFDIHHINLEHFRLF